MNGDGDGWVRCSVGHRHWGRFGAAGLLLTGAASIATERPVVLQHRASWTHEGGSWGLPGGARDSDEDVVSTALREAREEAAIEAATVAPLGWWIDDHGGWSYTTVVARARGPVSPHAANAESTEVRWWSTGEVDGLTLHRGLAGAWPRLRRPPEPLVLVVDGANVVGARPDGWWHDRLGAARRLRERLAGLARDGIPARELPDPVSAADLDGLFPAVALVVEGAARPLADERSAGGWWQQAISVHAAPEGDSAVVDRARAAHDAGMQTVVVSADRGLRRRLAAGVHASGPAWLLDRLARSRAG